VSDQIKPFNRRTAGEVRFIKDRSGDSKEWGWGAPGPSQREIHGDFEFNPRYLKPLARTLRSSLMAMGHALTAYDAFTRIKSADVSPDGSLGGKGYIQKITDMRRQYMNVVEALSALSDTIYDELKAPHWNPALEDVSSRARDGVKEILTDVEEIRDDPEAWAKEEEKEADEENQLEVPKQVSKTASSLNARQAALWSAYFGGGK